MRRILDLTLPLEPGMRGVVIEPASSLDADGWNASELRLYSHCGTHIDAPRHFLPAGNTIDQLALDDAIGTAFVVDVRPVAPRQEITVEDLGDAAERIASGSRVLLCTDWHLRHGTPEYRDALPRVGLDLARWLADRKIRLLGVEPPSVADVNDLEELTAVHRVLLEAGIVIVEGLANLSDIRSETVELVALPLKVHRGDGAPARVIALEIEEVGKDG